MSTVKRLLVPIDGSDASKKAGEKAIEIARRYDSEIVFLTVVNMPPIFKYTEYNYSSDINYDNIMRNNIEVETKMLNDTIEKMDLEGIRFEKKIVMGEPYEEILKDANESEYDYIVMGRRGYSKITRFFVGSVTQRVISEAPCPVIVVK